MIDDAKHLKEHIAQLNLVIQAMRLRLARYEALHTTPHVVKSTGFNGTTEERPHRRDTIEEYGPRIPCVTDRDIEKAEQ